MHEFRNDTPPPARRTGPSSFMARPGILRFAVAVTFAAIVMVTATQEARAQAGVLVGSAGASGASEVELAEMTVGVTVDRQVARTRVMQIFANRSQRPIEATYVFAIPTTAAIADFAVWDGDTRIPGVIIERRKARQLYEEIAARAIDPGLLEQEDDEEGSTLFTVRVAPVPAFGTKRIELEYTEILPVENLQSYYSFPLKPSQYGQQSIRHLRIDVEVLSGFELTPIELQGTQFGLAVDRQEPNALAAHFEGRDVVASEDLAFVYGIAIPESRLDVIAYRAPERILPSELRNPALARSRTDGYFQATAVLNQAAKRPGEGMTGAGPRSVIVALDTSLSMSGEKLDRAYEAVAYFLGALRPEDRFNLLLFNDDVALFSEKPVAGEPAEVERALQFVRGSYLSGGTNLAGALERAVAAADTLPKLGGERAIVLVTDGNPTDSTVEAKRVLETARMRNGAGPRARISVFGIGLDTRLPLLGALASESRGFFVWARETEDLAFKLKAFFSKVGRTPVDDVALAVAGGDVHQVYPETGVTGYGGSAVHFFGRYRQPGPATFRVTGSGGLGLESRFELPERADGHREVPRLWARARVDFLLARIELEGETEEAIDEIIALSKQHRFVTPYTSFIAAPRSLLRPRTIRPGDPVLRVRADESIVSIVAVFPFGLVKPLRFLPEEGVWETRFLAPRDMSDGQYACRLLMVDRQGRSFEELKRFRIDSRPPELRAKLEPARAAAGDSVVVTVDADADTRWIAARLYGGPPLPVRWDPERGASAGTLAIPAGLPPGTYTVEIAAEDFARNGASTRLELEILGR